MHCFVVVCCGHCTVAILLLLCTAEIESKWKGWYRIERWSNGIFWDFLDWLLSLRGGCFLTGWGMGYSGIEWAMGHSGIEWAMGYSGIVRSMGYSGIGARNGGS